MRHENRAKGSTPNLSHATPPNMPTRVSLAPRDLHSPDLDRRYRASLKAGRQDLPQRWPMGCGGAGNAFLVLLGPSPGKPPRDKSAAPGGANRPLGKPMRLGPGAISFEWGDGRQARWTRLCAAMLGDEERALSLTALLNLDWRNTTNQSDIPIEDLREGWRQHISPLLAEVRPRIVLALTNRVWRTVSEALDGECTLLSRCPARLTREPIAITIKGCGFPTLFLKAHNHPSRFLSYDEIGEIGRACRWFLET